MPESYEPSRVALPQRGSGRAVVGVAVEVAFAAEVVAFFVAVAAEEGRSSDVFFDTFRWAGAVAAFVAGIVAALIVCGWDQPARASLWAGVTALACAGLLALGALAITEAIAGSLG